MKNFREEKTLCTISTRINGSVVTDQNAARIAGYLWTN
jgi:hypothetical protein